MPFPPHLNKLIASLRRLPGVGNKTAERYAFALLESPKTVLKDFGDLLEQLHHQVLHCPQCGALMSPGTCRFCDLSLRQPDQLCIVASPRDLFALEETGEFRGLYHVLHHLLSPIEGRGPESLGLSRLEERITSAPIKEIIIALDATVDGDATALYLKDYLASKNLTISRLAFGVPMGSSLDYVDEGTLGRALAGRSCF